MDTPSIKNTPSVEESIDIKKYAIKVLTKWPLIAVCVIIAYTTSFIINRYTEPVYSVSMAIMINDEKKTSAELLMPSLDRFNARKNVENEMSILRSLTLAKKTIDELDFKISYYLVGRLRESRVYRPTHFYVKLDSLKATRTYYPIYVTILNDNECRINIDSKYKISKVLKSGEAFKHPDFNFTVYINKGSFFIPLEQVDNENESNKEIKYYFEVNDLNTLAQQYKNKLAINAADKRTTIVNLSSSGTCIEQEVEYLNKLCEVYIRSNLEEKNAVSTNTINFIDLQLNQISDSLKKAEAKLQNFRLENQMIDISSASSESYKKIQEYQAAMTIADMKLKYINYTKRYINSKTNFEDIIAPSVVGIEDPMLNKLISDLMDLYKQKNTLSLSGSIENPSLTMINLKMKKTIEVLNESFNENVNTINLSLKDLQDKTHSEEEELKKLPLTERQYVNIKREYDLNNNIFTFLLQRKAESGIAKASNVSDSKILDPARPESAYLIEPKSASNNSKALIIGLLAPLAFIFLKEFMNNKISDMRDLEKSKYCSIIGSVGHNTRTSDLPVFENPKSSLAESFRALRTNLQYLMRDKNDKTILLTSTVSGEGKTFCSINLSAILAMSNKRTLLIGLDLRKPKIHKLFNLPNDIGLSTYLINQSTKKDIILETNIDNLFIIPSGPVPPNPAELLETPEMENLMAELQQEFDYIILDTPPVAIVTDALLLCKFSNVNIFVARQDYSSKDVINLADDLAQKEGVKKLCILVNDVKVPGYYGYSYRKGGKDGYRYGYGYSYYSYGHEYYGEKTELKPFSEKLKEWFGIS
jgi:tyrosine-protein kinase Etk/Wzc